jgi:hypothetical protein
MTPQSNTHAPLLAVRRRQRTQAAINQISRAVTLVACLIILAELTRRLIGAPSLFFFNALTLLLCIIAAGVTGYLAPRSLKSSAIAIDTNCHLKDRAITALELSSLSTLSPVQSLALVDAQSHLNTVDARKVIPYTLPPRAWATLLAAALALAFPLLPRSTSLPTPVSPQLSQQIRTQAQNLADELQKAQDDAQKTQNPTLQKLAGDLKKLAEEIKDSNGTPREALLKLSEMQSAIRQEQAKFNTSLAQQHLKSLGQALASTDATKEAGKALQEGKNQEAAKALDEKTQLPLSSEDRKKLADDLKQAAQKMKADGMDEMANATDQLSQAAQNNNAKDFSQGAKSMGKVARDQAQRQKNQEWMDNQLSKLNDAKEQSTQSADSPSKGDQPGPPSEAQAQGQGKGDQPSQSQANAEGQGTKSGQSQGKKPQASNQWGTGKGDDPLGDQTKLDAKRQQQQLTGQLAGEGDSESQTSSSPQGKDTAKASYRQVHQRYQKLSESVLETEPLPLGQRQTIRRYFQSIRPDDTEK